MSEHDERWGGRLSCRRCGHPSGYHGVTFCKVDAGGPSKKQCDCEGWSPTEPERAVPPVDPPSDAVAILAAAQAAIDSLPPSMKTVPLAESREAEALRLLRAAIGDDPDLSADEARRTARSFLQAASTSSAGADE